LSEEKKERREIRESSDVEELRGVLKAVSDFLKDIKEPVSDLLSTLLGTISGDKLGDDVAKFYKRLKEVGMPDNEIRDLTRRYLEQRLALSQMLNKILSFMETHRGRRIEIKEEREKESED